MSHISSGMLVNVLTIRILRSVCRESFFVTLANFCGVNISTIKMSKFQCEITEESVGTIASHKSTRARSTPLYL